MSLFHWLFTNVHIKAQTVKKQIKVKEIVRVPKNCIAEFISINGMLTRQYPRYVSFLVKSSKKSKFLAPRRVYVNPVLQPLHLKANKDLHLVSKEKRTVKAERQKQN
jgi:hypothetical protein